MNPKRLMVNALACAALVVLWPSTAAAQRHGHGAFVVVGGGFYQPILSVLCGSGWYPGWYAGYPFYPPYGGYWYGPSYASIRVQVTPKQAEVYLDGYYVGVVDDFDGVFQRLDAPTGQHELQVYIQGYKTMSEKMLFRPGQSYKVQRGPAAAGPRRPAGPSAGCGAAAAARTAAPPGRAGEARRLKVRIRRRRRRHTPPTEC